MTLSKNNKTALLALSGVVFMVGLSFASVPLYDLFCRVTGYGGTPNTENIADNGNENITDISMNIRLDANVSPALNWSFAPVIPEKTFKIGERQTMFYRATNLSDTVTKGTATFNITPMKAGQYFNKIECFCFTEQALKPGESVDMGVSFFVDPDILKDNSTKDLRDITLSYSFFEIKDE